MYVRGRYFGASARSLALMISREDRYREQAREYIVNARREGDSPAHRKRCGAARLCEVHNLIHAPASPANIECSLSLCLSVRAAATATFATAWVNTCMCMPSPPLCALLIIELYRITGRSAARSLSRVVASPLCILYTWHIPTCIYV